jgi:hypothetical protein
MAASDVLGRIDSLMQALVLRQRAPAMTIAVMHDTVEEPPQEIDHNAAAHDEIRYLLRWMGDDGGPLAGLSGTRIMRHGSIQIDLAIYNGGEMTADWYKAQSTHLANAYGQVRSMLEDPNNHAKPTTGWLQARAFRCVEIVVEKDRLRTTMTFQVTFFETVGSL